MLYKRILKKESRLEREALRRDEEVAEAQPGTGDTCRQAQHLPRSRGDGNRWQLSERWRQLRRLLPAAELWKLHSGFEVGSVGD